MNVLSGYQLKVSNGGNTHIMDFTFGQERGCVTMIALYDRAATAVANEDSSVLEVPCALFSQLRDTSQQTLNRC